MSAAAPTTRPTHAGKISRNGSIQGVTTSMRSGTPVIQVAFTKMLLSCSAILVKTPVKSSAG